jgi:hypothetical protein
MNSPEPAFPYSRCRIAWEAWCAEALAMQLAECCSKALQEEGRKRYVRERVQEAVRLLEYDSSFLADALIELLEIVQEEASS